MSTGMSQEEKDCGCDNPANLANLDENAGPEPRIAEIEVCDNRVCEVGHILVRGDRVSFVSSELVRAVGEKKVPVAAGEAAWRDREGRFIPSDIRLPPAYVLVNDAAGRLLDRCEIYIVRWRNNKRREVSDIHRADLAAAQDYFGSGASIRNGFVDIPKGPWKRVVRVRYIRYERFGFDKPFEHRYDPAVDLFSTQPLAWRIPLPEGCVIDSRGFVRP